MLLLVVDHKDLWSARLIWILQLSPRAALSAGAATKCTPSCVRKSACVFAVETL